MNAKYLATLALLCAANVPAQVEGEMPAMPDMSPAKQLSSYEGLLGTWKGKGVVVHAPGTDEIPWTSQTHYRKVMNGHFIEEVTIVEVTGLGTLQMKGFYGYDKENKRYVSCGFSNFGTANYSVVRWADKKTMVTTNSGAENGQTTVERWVTSFGDGKQSIIGYKAISGGPEFVHVKGSSTKVDTNVKGIAVDASMGVMPANPAMAKLKGMVGTFKIKGRMAMSPEQRVNVTGKETMALIFGGSILEAKLYGDPMPGGPAYEGYGVWAWNTAKNCYDMIFLDSMGQMHHGSCHWAGKKLIFLQSGVQMGLPYTQRGVLKFDENGVFKGVSQHRMQGTQPPFESFNGEYTKVAK